MTTVVILKFNAGSIHFKGLPRQRNLQIFRLTRLSRQFGHIPGPGKKIWLESSISLHLPRISWLFPLICLFVKAPSSSSRSATRPGTRRRWRVWSYWCSSTSQGSNHASSSFISLSVPLGERLRQLERLQEDGYLCGRERIHDRALSRSCTGTSAVIGLWPPRRPLCRCKQTACRAFSRLWIMIVCLSSPGSGTLKRFTPLMAN